MADQAGMTQLSVVPAALQSFRGRVVYLARERRQQRLVALQLHLGSSTNSMMLEVLRQLDASLPSLEERCGFCQRVVAQGAKYCSKCGADLSVMPSGASDEVLDAVKQATAGRYEFLGRMEYGTRGGTVFVMRDLASGRLAALRLHKRQEEASGKRVYDLDHTNVVGQFAQEAGVGESGAPPDTRLLEAVQRSVGGEYEVLGELGRVVEAPPPAPARMSVVIPSVAPPPPPAPAKPPRRDNLLWLAISGAILVVLLVVGLIWSRGSRENALEAPPAARSQGPTGSADSATIDVGGELPAGARVAINGRSVGFGPQRIPVGTHFLEAEAGGFAPVAESLAVVAGDFVTWGPRLRSSRTAPSPSGPRPPASPATVQPKSAEPTCSSLFNASQDWDQVFRRCHAEGSSGSAVAQQILGLLYDKGLGTPMNHSAAADWFRQAAEAGNAKAQYQYGRLLRDGPSGVRRDREAAVGWFTKAAQQGDVEAMAGLGRAFVRGEGTRKSEAEGAQWYRQAVDGNVVEAAFELSLLYRDGKGVPKSDSLAFVLMDRAASRGHPGAAKELPKFRERYVKKYGQPGDR